MRCEVKMVKWIKINSGLYNYNCDNFEAISKQYTFNGIRYWQSYVRDKLNSEYYSSQWRSQRDAKIACEIFIYFNYETRGDWDGGYINPDLDGDARTKARYNHRYGYD